MDILFHLTREESANLLLGFGAACGRAGVSWGCFFTNDGVKVLANKAVQTAMEGADKAVVCEHSWDRYMAGAHNPVERGSQTVNSKLMAEAGRVVSL